MSLASLPIEVLSLILAGAEDPHCLVVTCRSLFLAAQDIQTQAEWWHFNQSKTSLLRLFRWRWLFVASLTVDQLDNFLVSILTKRSEDAQASWHGAFAVARAAVFLGLPQTFQVLLSRGVADPFKWGGVLVADMLALNRNEMLQQVKQKIGERRSTDAISRYKEGSIWWTDMKAVAQWWISTPAEELKKIMAAGETAEEQKISSVQISEANEGDNETVSMLDSVDFDSDTDSKEDSDADDSQLGKETEGSGDSLLTLSAFESFVQFTRGVMHVGGEFGEALPPYEIGDKITWDGIGQFASRDCMEHLAEAVLLGCRAGMPESFLRNLLTILPRREKNSVWKEVLLARIEVEMVESELGSQELDNLDSALEKEYYPLCLKKVRAWRELDGDSGNWGAVHLVTPRVIERADEEDIAKAVANAYRNRVVGIETDDDALPALLESGAWLGVAPRDDIAEVYWYELGAREFRAGLMALLGVRDEDSREERLKTE